MQVQLPNGVSIVLGVALVAALSGIAGELPGQVPDWTGLALAAVIGGIAKAVQVWVDSQKQAGEVTVQAAANTPSRVRRWLAG
jgi:hypothetical protein